MPKPWYEGKVFLGCERRGCVGVFCGVAGAGLLGSAEQLPLDI